MNDLLTNAVTSAGAVPPKRIRTTKLVLLERIGKLEAELKEMAKLTYFAVGLGFALGAGATLIGFAFK
jgi:hypothetical protein